LVLSIAVAFTGCASYSGIHGEERAIAPQTLAFNQSAVGDGVFVEGDWPRADWCGPQQTPTKQRVTLRLSPEVVQHYKPSAPGWQTRIDLDLLGKIGARNKGRIATASAPRRRMKAKAA
jgi:uncharacterized protein (DUF4415 family)